MASSWSLTSAKDLSAELRLAQAISEFQSHLSAQEKIEFQKQKVRYSKQPPTTQDVYKLTAEIDCVSGKTSGGRVFGPRFMNVLQAAQRFASIGDVLIGGSQNLIACGVWVGVRFLLLAVTTSATLVSKISELFMLVGRHAPKYEELSHLYPESKSLQEHLLEYYIVVIRLCQYVLRYAQKSKLGHFIASLSDSELEKYRVDLDTRGRCIKEEVLALTMSLIKAEASRSEKFRVRYLGESQNAIQKREAKVKAKLLECCSKYDYESSWKQLRKAGTATCFSDEVKYRGWRSNTNSSTLIWTGKIGCGKSVMLANIVDDLNLNLAGTQTLVTYFFCQWDHIESLRAKTILGSLAKQILKALYDSTNKDPSWKTIIEENGSPNLAILADLIHKIVSQTQYRILFVLDGFDDCTEQEAAKLCYNLEGLQKAIRLSICVSTGTDYDLTSDRSPLKTLRNIHAVSVPEKNPDIETFVDAELARCLESGDLVLREPTLILEIRNALLDGAQGMMLWVVMQIGAICAEKSDEKIREALKGLPKSLSMVFDRELHRCDSKVNIKDRDKAILLLLGCVRPLTLDEFAEAISIEPKVFDWKPAQHVNDVRPVIKACGKLLMVEEESLTVRISHHSIKKYLMKAYTKHDGALPSDFEIQLGMAHVVVTYLSYGVFDRQLSTRVVPHLPTRHVAPTIIATTVRSHTAADLALKLLQLKRAGDFDVGKTVAKLTEGVPLPAEETFPFRNYAEQYFMEHTWTYITIDDARLTKALIDAIQRLLPKVWDVSEQLRNNGPTLDPRKSSTFAMEWSSYEGQTLLLRWWKQDMVDVALLRTLKDEMGDWLLSWAATKKGPELLQYLINRFKELKIEHGFELKDSFFLTLRRSCFFAADLFWTSYFAGDLGSETVLLFMVVLKKVEAVEWLLDHKYSADILYLNPLSDGLDEWSYPARDLLGPKYVRGSYPLLFFAIMSENAEMVYLCLRHGALITSLTQHFISEDLNRVFSFLVRHEFVTIYRKLLFTHCNGLGNSYKNFFGRKARALKDSDNNELEGYLSYVTGDIIDIARPGYGEYEEEWWYGCLGMDFGDFLISNMEPVTEVLALYDYRGQASGELSFHGGDVIVVLKANYPNWWEGELDGKTGVFPVNYVKCITLDHQDPRDSVQLRSQRLSTQTRLSEYRLNQSVREKEEQLRREEEKLREIELKVQREINEKRKELLAREAQLKEIEARILRDAAAEQARGGGSARIPSKSRSEEDTIDPMGYYPEYTD